VKKGRWFLQEEVMGYRGFHAQLSHRIPQQNALPLIGTCDDSLSIEVKDWREFEG